MSYKLSLKKFMIFTLLIWYFLLISLPKDIEAHKRETLKEKLRENYIIKPYEYEIKKTQVDDEDEPEDTTKDHFEKAAIKSIRQAAGGPYCPKIRIEVNPNDYKCSTTKCPVMEEYSECVSEDPCRPTTKCVSYAPDCTEVCTGDQDCVCGDENVIYNLFIRVIRKFTDKISRALKCRRSRRGCAQYWC